MRTVPFRRSPNGDRRRRQGGCLVRTILRADINRGLTPVVAQLLSARHPNRAGVEWVLALAGVSRGTHHCRPFRWSSENLENFQIDHHLGSCGDRRWRARTVADAVESIGFIEALDDVSRAGTCELNLGQVAAADPCYVYMIFMTAEPATLVACIGIAKA